MNNFMEYTIAGNELWRIAGLFVSILLGLLCGKIARVIFKNRGRKLQQKERLRLFGLILECVAGPAVMLFFIFGLWSGFRFIRAPASLQGLIDTVLRILATIAAGFVIYSLVDVIDYYITRWAGKSRTKIDDMLAPLIKKTLRITVVIIVILLIAQSLSDKPLSAVVASLGVGGLAIALASQEMVKNFFGALVIMGDKPFQVGDRVVIDGEDGKVEEVGFRSMKMRTLDGHLVTVPNSTVASSTIRNIGVRPYIKKVANIGITYGTPPEKVERAVKILKEILDNHEGMEPGLPPLVFFNEIKDYSLNILVIYWFHPPDFIRASTFAEKVNMEILKRFNAEGIDFAFPSQTIYMANRMMRSD